MAKGRPLLLRCVCQDCEGCSSRAYCLSLEEKRRILLLKQNQLIRAEMRATLKKPQKRAIYRKRKWMAEQVKGQMKAGFGFRGVTVRGQEFTRAQYLFICAVHKVMKAVRFISGLRRRETVTVMGW
jgi:hypothetical protein